MWTNTLDKYKIYICEIEILDLQRSIPSSSSDDALRKFLIEMHDMSIPKGNYTVKVNDVSENKTHSFGINIT